MRLRGLAWLSIMKSQKVRFSYTSSLIMLQFFLLRKRIDHYNFALISTDLTASPKIIAIHFYSFLIYWTYPAKSRYILK